MPQGELVYRPDLSPEELKALQKALEAPFPIEAHEFKPQATSRDKKKAMGVAYVDPRYYQDRLDQVDPTWSSRIEVHLSEKSIFVVSTLTVLGRSRTATGECLLSDTNSMTSAEAQAFKRACTAQGLGRYIYMTDKVWADYDEANRRFTDEGIKKLKAAIAHFVAGKGGQASPPQQQARTVSAPASQPAHDSEDELVARAQAELGAVATHKAETPQPNKAGGNGNGVSNTTPTEFWTVANAMIGHDKLFKNRDEVKAFLESYGGSFGVALGILQSKR